MNSEEVIQFGGPGEDQRSWVTNPAEQLKR